MDGPPGPPRDVRTVRWVVSGLVVLQLVLFVVAVRPVVLVGKLRLLWTKYKATSRALRLDAAQLSAMALEPSEAQRERARLMPRPWLCARRCASTRPSRAPVALLEIAPDDVRCKRR